MVENEIAETEIADAESKYVMAPDIYERYVVPLINDHRSDLAQVRIVTMLRSGEWKSKGIEVWAYTKKVSAETKTLIGVDYDYLITVNAEVWGLIAEAQKQAIIDHELAHCLVDEDKDGNPVYKLVSHDIEEFFSIIRRHGDWHEGIKRALKAFEDSKQVTMFDLESERRYREEAKRDAEFGEAFSAAPGQ